MGKLLPAIEKAFTKLRRKRVARMVFEQNGIPVIEALSDNDRALVCSDGRKILGEWLIVNYP